MGMSSVSGIAKAYFSTLRDQRTKKINMKAMAFQVAVPVVAGVIWFFCCDSIVDISNAITGISIVSALLCAMATMLFQIRIDLRVGRESNKNTFNVENDLEFVDELFYAVLWVILFGLLIVLFMMIIDWVPAFQTKGFLARCISGIYVAVIFYFVLVVGLILKRLLRVYELVALHKR